MLREFMKLRLMRKREFASFVKSVQESLSELFSSSRITTELVVLPCHTSPRQRIRYQKLWGLVKCLLVLSPGGGGVYSLYSG